jgi:hypothetical protein
MFLQMPFDNLKHVKQGWLARLRCLINPGSCNKLHLLPHRIGFKSHEEPSKSQLFFNFTQNMKSNSAQKSCKAQNDKPVKFNGGGNYNELPCSHVIDNFHVVLVEEQ